MRERGNGIHKDIEPLLGEVIGERYGGYVRRLIAKDLFKKLKSEDDDWLRYLMLEVLVTKLLFRTDKRLPDAKSEYRRLKKRISAKLAREAKKL